MDPVGTAALPESRNVGNDQFRIDFPHTGVVEAPSRVRARLGTLHPDIGARDQLKEKFLALRLRKIERDEKDVAAFLNESGRHRVATIFCLEPNSDSAPSGVASAGTLDLDHFGAHFGRQLRGEWLRDQRSGGNNFDTLRSEERRV